MNPRKKIMDIISDKLHRGKLGPIGTDILFHWAVDPKTDEYINPSLTITKNRIEEESEDCRFLASIKLNYEAVKHLYECSSELMEHMERGNKSGT